MEQSIPTKILKRFFGESTAVPFWILSWAIVPVQVRVWALGLFGWKIATGVRMFPGSHFVGRKLEIGAGSFINSGCHLDATDVLRIGRDVHLSPGVRILTITHELSGPDRRAGRIATQPVVIEDGAWIGAGATILPGVTVHRGAVIAAGAIVTSDCGADQLYAGVPATSVRLLPTAAAAAAFPNAA